MSALRRGRNSRSVAVTGAAGGLGALVAARLTTASGVGRVVGVDTVRGSVPGVVWRRADVRSPLEPSVLKGVDVVVHLAVDTAPGSDDGARRRLNVEGARHVLVAAAGARVVLVTSAMVYGATPEHDVPLDESAALDATPDTSVVGDHLEVERLAAAHPGPVVVLRPALLVGPHADSALLRLLEAPRLLAVRGARTRWQLCHTDDLVAAIVVAVTGELTGPVNVASPGWLEVDEVAAVSGRRRVELPLSVATGTAARLHRLGIAGAPAHELGYLLHPWVVSVDRLLAAGWTPAHDNAAALAAHLDVTRSTALRRVDPRAAAGATLAVVATAAVVRSARRRRGR